jgi:hypothetical protein
MTRLGVISPSRFLQTDKVRELMSSRALAMMKEAADQTRFVMLPLGLLVGSSGMLAAFRANGVTVTPRA